MAEELGKVAPGFHDGEETRIWRCPVEVYDSAGNQFDVMEIYADEGVLCLTIQERSN